MPAIGYGIRYEFGIFDQVIHDGWQVEVTDKWLRLGNPWEIARPEITYQVKFGGRTEPWTDERGQYRVRWTPDTVVMGVAYDTPDPRLPVDTCNLCGSGRPRRSSRSISPPSTWRLLPRGRGEGGFGEHHQGALPQRRRDSGQALRLQQQFFFVSCSLQDMLRIHLKLEPPA